MTIRELQKRLDKLEQRAKAERLGVLPIVTEIDLDTVEAWDTLTPEECDEFRTTSEHRTTEPTGDTLSAIIVRVWLPDEEEIWRLTHVDTEPERIEPLQPRYESAPPTFRELREAYEADLRQRQSI